jgi:hypothetical protein
MKARKTRYDKLQQKISALQVELCNMECDKKRVEDELERYIRRHRSLKFDGLETGDTGKLIEIYRYFDKRYPVEWQGGLRGDDRGMSLCYWVDDDPDFLILHLSSISDNICFSGSTSWQVKAVTLSNKVDALMRIKKDIQKILKAKTR